MRACLLLSEDRLYKPSLLEEILRHRRDTICAVAEVADSRRPRRGWRKRVRRVRKQYRFWGLRGAVTLGMRSAGLSARGCLPQRLAGNVTLSDVCRDHGVPWRFAADVDSTEFLDWLRGLSPDVIVSFQHQIFGPELLELPTMACINCHPARLPDYRGIKPIFWAMLNGEDEIGVTVHTMTDEIDVGRIVAQRTFPNQEGISLLENYRRAYAVAADTIVEALDRMGDGRLEDLPELSPTAPYYKWPKAGDLERFRRSGLRIA